MQNGKSSPPTRRRFDALVLNADRKDTTAGTPPAPDPEFPMTDSIKARYRESGNDSMATSTILFEIAVSIDEEDREMRADTNQESINFFDRLVGEYNDAVGSNAQADMNFQEFGQPNTE
jgi:hypothetical protein